MDLEAQIHDLLKGKQTAAVICNQWGDTGKGKFSDMFGFYWADVIARGTGGNNAGHTVVINGVEYIFHLLPSGILYDAQDKVNVLGNGMVIDIGALCKEMDWLEGENGSYNNLMISKDAHITLPFHKSLDREGTSQEKGGIGTTGRGIGPTYSDKFFRTGIMIKDLYNPDVLRQKLKKALVRYEAYRRGKLVKMLSDESPFDVSDVKDIDNIDPKEFIDMFKEIYSKEIDIESEIGRIMEELKPFAERIKPFVRDTMLEMSRFHSEGKNILLEGAQGLLLSPEYGTYPYVTSSDPSLNGTAMGVGLPANLVDICFGIIKYPFMTRVGAGPFPSEFSGFESEKYCAEGLVHDIFYEANHYLGMPLDLDHVRKLQKEERNGELRDIKNLVYDYIKHKRQKVLELINNKDPFISGVGIRLAALEYGATTGRPRRTGWTDAVAAKYAVRINGPNFILTKPDSIGGCSEFNLCFGYNDGSKVHTEFDRDCEFLKGVTPELKSYEGYPDIKGMGDYEGLPSTLRESVDDFERFTGGKVAIISTGPEKEDTAFRKKH